MMCQPQLPTKSQPPKTHIFPQVLLSKAVKLSFFWHRWDYVYFSIVLCVCVCVVRLKWPTQAIRSKFVSLSLCLNPVQRCWRPQPPKNIALSLSEDTGSVFIFSVLLPNTDTCTHMGTHPQTQRQTHTLKTHTQPSGLKGFPKAVHLWTIHYN